MRSKKVFREVSSRPHFPEVELEIMRAWAEEGTFRKSLAQTEGKPRFVFYEGPPTANGHPGTHHVLARAFKDLFGRYKTMKGFYVERKAGWDTHGLPVELEVEKQLGISGKQQIEDFGIERFNDLCRASVHEYVDEWRVFSERMAFWQDYDDAYWTYHSDYIQSVWWALKRMWDQGLIYKGFRVAPYCPRCATPLSSHELAQGYQDDTPDPSVYVRFRLKGEPGTSILAWTTTPWTLPGNVALAVGEDIDYVKVEQNGERLILAEARLSVLEGEYTVVERFQGKDLLDLDYEPLYPYSVPPEGRAQYVVSADFVSTEDGTGVVHTSALYGADDLRLCQEKGIPFRHTVDLRGRFFPEVQQFAGLFVKDADPEITEDLRERGLLYRSGQIRHSYPFCWRCKTPLIYYALDSWYIRTTERKAELLANNNATNWVPEHIKAGRMGDWLENNVDWAFSRSRYWGTPVPIWVCGGCAEQRCVESAVEIGLDPEADLHRPYVDDVVLTCGKCGGEMRRVPEVVDCWFDSGCMPFAQRGYPQKNRELFAQTFPADYISEAIDQTRGWFYSLLAISTLNFGQNSYRNVICLGHILDAEGLKMSKSRGNIMDPDQAFAEFGVDAVRWLFFTQQVGESYRLGAKTLQEVVRRFLLTIWNVYSFFVTYANVDGFAPGLEEPVPVGERPALDRWLLARLNGLVRTVGQSLDAYDVNGAARPVEGFVEDLSNWYVRRSRRRFWKSSSDRDKLAAYQTLHTCLVTMSRLLAPFTPFVADSLHRNLAGSSAHLAGFPEPDPALLDEALEAHMRVARQIVADGLAERDKARIKVRQPLRALDVPFEPLPDEIDAIVRDELNVKEVRYNRPLKLDTEITRDLMLEGKARDLVRLINAERKAAGLNVDDRVVLYWWATGEYEEAFLHYGGYIGAEVLAVQVIRERPAGLAGSDLGENLWIGLKRAG